jgi:branched-chain amino acid transport system substrate-binding protein
MTMRKALVGFATFAAAVLAVSSAQAQQTIKIGVILAYSGQFADPSAQMDNGIKLYMKQHGDTAAGKKIELIRKDTGGIAPDIAKRLAQELIVRDNSICWRALPSHPTRSQPATCRRRRRNSWST